MNGTRPSQGSYGLFSFVSGVVVGLAVNAVSDAYPGAGAPIIGVAVLCVVGIAVVLRRYPATARLHRLTARLCLAGAALAVVLYMFASSSTANWTLVVAGALGVAGCATPAGSAEINFMRLAGVAFVAFSLPFLGLAINEFREAHVLIGLALIGFGSSVAIFGVANLRGSVVLMGVSAIGSGVAFATIGVSWLSEAVDSTSLVLIGFGASAVLFGLWLLTGARFVLAVLALCLTVIGAGVVTLWDGDVLFGVSLLVASVAILLYGLGLTRGSELLVYSGNAVAGLSLLGVGLHAMLELNPLLGLASIGGGVGFAGAAIVQLARRPQIVAWIKELVTESSPDMPHQAAAADKDGDQGKGGDSGESATSLPAQR